MYFNARSVLPKIDFLRVLCAIHSPDCVCIVESWLSDDIENSELCICGYDIVRLDRNRHGGGVLLFINSVYTHNIVFSGSIELELLIVSVSLKSVPITIALFYRPPGSPFVIFDTLLSTLCNHVDPYSLSNLILLGDFNVNYLETSHPLFSKLLLLSNSLSLTQCVTQHPVPLLIWYSYPLQTHSYFVNQFPLCQILTILESLSQLLSTKQQPIRKGLNEESGDTLLLISIEHKKC